MNMKNLAFLRALYSSEINTLDELLDSDDSDVNKLKICHDKLAEFQWYKIHSEIMAIENDELFYGDINFIIRKHILYIKCETMKLIEKSRLNFEQKSLHNFRKQVMDVLEGIAIRTIIFDFQIVNEGSNFNEYIEYFKNNELSNFYHTYPILARLLSIKTLFFIQNIQILINDLGIAAKTVPGIEDANQQIVISDLIFLSSDSHSNGKTVISIEFNHKLNLVYKKKSLEIANSYKKMITWINNKDPKFKFAAASIYNFDGFTLEEKINRQEILNENAISDYYRYYGHLIGLMYSISGKDFHYENLIIAGTAPIPVDLESLLYFDPFNKVQNKSELIIKNNVNQIGLVPQWSYINNKKVDFSSLTPSFKDVMDTYQLMNRNKNNMKFSLIKSSLIKEHHVLQYQGNTIPYNFYNHEIIKGFEEIYCFILENKIEFIKRINEYFKDVEVRAILRNTQVYAELVGNSLFPKCTINGEKREQVFNYLKDEKRYNIEIVQSEVEDLLNLDIPIFFINTSKNELMNSSHKKIKVYEGETLLEQTVKKVENMSLQDLKLQNLFLNMSLDDQTIYQTNICLSKNKNLNDENQLWKSVLEIERVISKIIMWEEDKVDWLVYEVVDPKQNIMTLNSVNLGLYNGIHGVFLFYYYLLKIDETEEIRNKVRILENELALRMARLKLNSNADFIVYIDHIYYLKLKLKETMSSDIERQIMQIAQQIFNYAVSEDVSLDWLTGKAGLAKIFVDIYKICGNKILMDYAFKMLHSIKPEEIESIGFAHGFSGIIFSHYYYYVNCEPHEEFKRKIKFMLNREREKINDYRKQNNIIKTTWCNGKTGIILSRAYLLEHNFPDDLLKEEIDEFCDSLEDICIENDSLCHGNFANFDVFKELLRYKNMTDHQQNLLEKYLKQSISKEKLANVCLLGQVDFPEIGLFEGVAGIGLVLLRLIDTDKVPLILNYG